MDNQHFFDEMALPKRSTFLTVLCILSFIGSGYGILSSAMSFAMFKNGTMQTIQANQAKNLEKLKESKKGHNSFAIKMMENAAVMMDPEKIKLSNTFKIISCALTLAGALLMFKLKVLGYGIYIVGCLLEIGSVFYIYGTGNFAATMGVVIVGLFSLIFIILYGMCVKEMVPQKVIE